MARIVVAEDEPPIREEVMDWLVFEGYDVVGAENGRVALEAIQDELPDLIISDVRMPEMDGYELLYELRSNPDYLRIPFIFLTASAERDSVRRGMATGADDYLTKPFPHSEVLDAVRARLERKTTQESQIQEQMDRLYSALGEEREKRQLKSRLVAMFSHDFRNPLSSILFSSGMLRNYADRLTPERKLQHLDRIDSSVHVLIQMLDDMLMVAEMEAGHLAFDPQRINVAGFISDLVEDFRLIDQGAHTIVLNSTFRKPAEVDPKLLRHIVGNLVSNAMKYSPPDTEITISLYAAENDQIGIEIQDNGIGIPQNELHNLFEPFHRAANVKDAKGHGLGLTVVKECVDRHQGKVEIDSEIDKGTRFVVLLPQYSQC